MAMSGLSRSLTPAASAIQISILGGALYHVNVPTRDQATVAVAQIRDGLDSMYVSSPSLRARASSSNHVNDRAMEAFRLMTESPQAQEVVAEVVSDHNVFSAICASLQRIPVFGNIVANCLIQRDLEDLAEHDEISSSAERNSWWVRMFRMFVEAISSAWDRLMGLFAGVIPGIQAAFAGQGGNAAYLETALIITGLVVLVTAVIIVGAILVL